MPRAQSAMEYLMTYGWAILIIAVVLIGLSYLGVFNSETFAPKASPGACYVLRTAAEVSLAGECNNYIPRSVGQFNGQNSYISIPSVSVSASTLTVSAWVDPYSVVGNMGIAGQGRDGSASWELKVDGTQYDFVVYEYEDYRFGTVATNSYVFLTAVYNSGNVYLYVNGNQVATYTGGPSVPASLPLYIGYAVGDNGPTPWYMNGNIANVQIYNSSLSAGTIQAMYADGIGGAPIQLQNLVGWWPLNGNTYDYSGNGNNGANNNVVFNPNWYTAYTPT